MTYLMVPFPISVNAEFNLWEMIKTMRRSNHKCIIRNDLNGAYVYSFFDNSSIR